MPEGEVSGVFTKRIDHSLKKRNGPSNALDLWI